MVLLQVGELWGVVPNGVYVGSYLLKALACAGFFIWLKPWRGYPALRLQHLPWAIWVGGGVAVIWILPETPWMHSFAPGIQEFYHQWLILPPGVRPDYFNPSYYPELPPGHRALSFAPEVWGWGVTLGKLWGSACVIAVIEEFFFRGFFYRWLLKNEFWTVPLKFFDARAFWMVVLVFGVEHDRWVVGIVAGVAYGCLALRTGDIWAVAIAHGLTNLLLGIYVILSRQYGFW